MKKILIDLRFLKNLYYGFGQYCLSFGNYLKNNPDSIKDLDITLLVPKEYIGHFGDHVKYMETKRIYKYLPFLAPKFDVWHSTTQSQRYFSINESCAKIITIHDLNLLEHHSKKKAQKRLKRLQKNVDMSDHFTVISNFTKGEVAKHIDFKQKQVTVNYVGVQNISRDKKEKPSFVEENKEFLFTIGQVVDKKNFHVLIDMMKLMPQYNLYICGQDYSAYADNIKQRIKEENVKNVSVTGAISPEEKVWMLENCKGFVFPSKLEGFGIPVIEAMHFAKPVFSSRLTSLNEIGDKYAYFWENFEPEHMKEVVEQNIDAFYNNPQLIKDQLAYAESYSIERSCENFLELYRSLPKKKSSLIKDIRNLFSYWIF